MGDFRQRALAALGAAAGMTALPAAYWYLDEHGPASRVIFRSYLPDFGSFAILLGGGVVGASLGAEAALRLGNPALPYSVARVAAGCLGGGALAVLPGILAGAALDARLHGLDWLAPAASFGVMGLGGCLGGFLVFRTRNVPSSTRRLPLWRLAALALVVVAAVATQLHPFPSSGTLAERDEWARAHVREYPGLARIVARVPEVVDAVGTVIVVAPTAHDQHTFAREMDGDGLRFTLEVVGERGAGTFFADGTIEGDRIVDWRAGSWTFAGKTSPIDPRTPARPPVTPRP